MGVPVHLAIDLGASSGRHVLGYMQDGEIKCEEIHRFANTPKGSVWDIDELFRQIIIGMKKCAEMGHVPESVGIDTWGVDFVLLDGGDNLLGPAVSYRDDRTRGMEAEVSRFISDKELYARTGIQKLVINTIYQLMAVKMNTDYLGCAKRLLMLPDYFHYRLTGYFKTEYTNATTTGLVSARERVWDDDLLSVCGYPKGIFGEIVPPGTVLGGLLPEIQKQVGYNCLVVLPATHDTASAVVTVPKTGPNNSRLYISSGTWSLMGTVRDEPICTEESRLGNFTNEGGYGGSYRYLKNIMGLWMIQQVKKELGDDYSYEELDRLAADADDFSLEAIDVNHSDFLAPPSMIKAIQDHCAVQNLPVPRTPGQIAAVIYNGLALSYSRTA